MEPTPTPATDAPSSPAAAAATDAPSSVPGAAAEVPSPPSAVPVAPTPPSSEGCRAAAPIEPAALDLRWPYLATGLSALLLFASFHPMDQGGLAWVAFVPWLVVAAIVQGRTAVVMSYATTALYHLVGLSWIGLVSPEGWLTTVFLEGFYGIALATIPLWVRRRTGLPLALSLPVVGAALELARGNTPVIRFPWLLIGQSQHARDALVQLADVTSVYGLSFLVLAVNGGLVDAALLLRARWLQGREPDTHDRTRLAAVLAGPLLLVGLAWLYGVHRKDTVREALTPGPWVLVVQPDYPQSLKDPPELAENVAEGNLSLTAKALERRRKTRDQPPVDLIVWSETMWPWPIPDDSRPGSREAWNEWLSQIDPTRAALIESYTRRLFEVPVQAHATLIVGAVDDPDRLKWIEPGDPRSVKPHNSVYALSPDGRGVVGRYDKINLVPASEYIPGDGTTLFSWVPKLVQAFIPKGFHFESFGSGEGPVLFPVPGHDAEGKPVVYNAAIDVCFEISFPELLRESVAKDASFHVCPANDGWFVRGGIGEGQETAELRLARDHAQLRAIEGRRPVVRCVNRGVSLVMDPLGEVAPDDLVYAVRGGKIEVVGIEGTFITQLETTRLVTFYVAHGDVFAWGCVLGSVVLIALAVRRRRVLAPVEAGGIEPPPPPGAPAASPAT
jgi:apolipoprotein N-acyltransferase